MSGPKPPLQLALMPKDGYASVTPVVAERLAERMADINAQGIPVWLRYAHEMNGDWYSWGMQPDTFIKSWRMLASAVHAKAPDTYMLFSPNSLFGEEGQTQEDMGGWSPYWPGQEYVDIVGLSFYHYGGFERLNKLPERDEAVTMMKRFHSLYASVHKKPFILSETSGAFSRNATTNEPAPGGADEKEIKMEWLRQITSQELIEAIPSYAALCWFEILKNENAGGDSDVKKMDFRLVTSDRDDLNTAALRYLAPVGSRTRR